MSFCADKIFNDVQNDKDKDLQDMAKHLKKSDLVKLVNHIRGAAKNYKSQGIDDAAAMEKAINEKIEQARIHSEMNKKSARMALVALEKKNVISNALNDDIKKVNSALFNANAHSGEGVRLGDDAKILARTAEILHGPNGIVPQLEKIGGIKALEPSGLEELKHLSQQGIGMSPDDPTLPFNYDVAQKILDQNFDDTLAGKVAKIFKDHDDYKRKLFSEYGIEVPELYDRITRQYNDTNKILRPNGFHKAMMDELGVTGPGKWAKYLLKQKQMHSVDLDKLQRDVAYKIWKPIRMKDLDMARSFPNTDITNPDAIDAEMRERFDKMTAPANVDDLHNTDNMKEDNDYGESNYFQEMANQSRSFHVTSGKAFVDYSRTYGAGNLLASVEREAHTLGHTLTMLESWGPNPISTYKKFIQHNFGDRTDRSSLNTIKKMNRTMAYLAGQLRPDADHMLGRFSKAIQTFNVLKGLGMVTLRSLPDAALNWRQLNSWGVSLEDQVKSQIDGFRSGKDDQQLKDFFDTLGVSSRHMIGNRHVVDARSFQGLGSKYEALMMKMNFLPHWDLSRKRVAFAGVARHLARYADTEFENLPNELKKKFDLYALNKNEWDAWRKGATKLEDGLTYLSPHYALHAPEEDILATQDPNDIKGTSDQLRNVLYRKLSAMYHGEYKYVVPGNSLEARATRAFHNQSTVGQALNLVMQFKGYAVGYVKNVLGRDIGEADNGMHAAWNLARTIGSSVALGIASQYAVNFFENKQTSINPLHEEGLENWWESIQSALGIFGDGLSTLTSSNTANKLISMLGPAATDASNILSYMHEMGKHAYNWFTDNTSKEKKSALLLTEQALQNNMPFHNTPVASFVMNYAMSRVIMNMIQPGSFDQKVNEMKNKYGVTPIY